MQESELESLRADAFVVMFSIADQESYTSALDMIRHLRVNLGLDRAILLVGNKVDLARQRKVNLRGEQLLSLLLAFLTLNPEVHPVLICV